MQVQKGGKLRMNRAESVVKYYVLCNKLKNVVRTGWKNFKIKSDRLESVAEHIYGTQMLAIAVKSEYEYDVDIEKVLKMLAVHETEEILIGDLTMFEISKEEKEIIGHGAVKKIFAGLMDGEEYENLINEFDERKTEEAKFAYFCDKLEADLQARIYDLNGCADVETLENSNKYFVELKNETSSDNELSWGQAWIKSGQIRYGYDSNFYEISEFAMNNDILDIKADK